MRYVVILLTLLSSSMVMGCVAAQNPPVSLADGGATADGGVAAASSDGGNSADCDAVDGLVEALEPADPAEQVTISMAAVPMSTPKKPLPKCTKVVFAKVAPVLSSQCGGCHSFSSSCAAAKAEQSQIKSKVNSGSMPPKKKLTAAQKSLILQWISDGRLCSSPGC